jgi:hypothetical protein
MEINNKILISLLGIGTCITTASLLAARSKIKKVNEKVDDIDRKVNVLGAAQVACWDTQYLINSDVNDKLNSVEEKLNTKTKKSK